MANASTTTSLEAPVRLTHLAALDVSGADAEKFLQGQTSAQVSLADERFAPLTCFCTPKGRMLANAQLIRMAPDHIRLVMHTSLVDSLAAHLGKFAPFYQAKLSAPDTLDFIGVAGDASMLAAAAGLEVPAKPLTHQSSRQANLLRMPDARWLLCCEQAVSAELSPSDEEPGRNAWQVADINGGIAWLTDAQRDHFLPQMLNWEALGGISFKKGCYTGQEVVARAHFRGQVKKRLVSAGLEASSLPDVGAALCDETGKSLGEVVNAAFSSPSNVALLAVINTKVQDNQLTLYWDDQPIDLHALPYAVERVDPEQLVAALA